MPVKQAKDEYANVAYLEHTVAVANGIEFQRLDVVSGALLGQQKFGLLIKKVEYFTRGWQSLTMFALETDEFRFGLSISDALSDTDLHHPEILDQVRFGNDWRNGAAAVETHVKKIEPVAKDFTSIGGILTPADRLYLYTDGTRGGGTYGGSIIQCKMYYTTVELTTEAYWELIEARRIIST